MIKTLFSTYLAMIFGVNIFINSGFLDYILMIIKTIFNVPAEIFPLAIIRPISSSASLAYLNTIFEKYGPDSFIGILGSVMQGSTDTTFYVLTLYFGSVGIKKIRYSLFCSLFADIIGILASIFIVGLLFG